MSADSPAFHLSLNEIKTTVEKAARARGFAAAQAQDAGAAAALLCAHGHDGARAALAALAQPAPQADAAPPPDDQPGARLFPAARAIAHAGAAADLLLAEGGAAQLCHLDAPLLATAILANTAIAHSVTFELRLGHDAAISLHLPHTLVNLPLPAFPANANWHIRHIAPPPRPPAAPPQPAARAIARQTDWQQLQNLAQQTAVPATAQSRANAGADQTDND